MNGFTPAEAQAILERERPPATSLHDQEELETYINGPDDPVDYFSKFASEAELLEDFDTFLGGYERG